MKRVQSSAHFREGSLLGRPVKPMLATLVEQPFDRSGWLFEIKWDGYRAIAEVADGRVKLYSRNFKPFETKFAPITHAFENFGHDVVLDGEIVALDDQGKAQFQLLQQYQKSGAGTLVYYVFDLLYLDGRDLRTEQLARRKQKLATLLKKSRNNHIRLSEHIEDFGVALFRAACDQSVEGIVAKDGASPYREGMRGGDWLKVKTRRRQEAVIGGFTRPRRTRQGLGALVLGVFENGKLVYVGHAGGGFTDQSLLDMRKRLEALVQKSCPFDPPPKTNMPAQWVKPVLVCEVAFQEWTGDGSMRQPIFLGLREDKAARSVHREQTKPITVTPR